MPAQSLCRSIIKTTRRLKVHAALNLHVFKGGEGLGHALAGKGKTSWIVLNIDSTV